MRKKQKHHRRRTPSCVFLVTNPDPKKRLGDSAVIGAGLFVNNEVGAATSSCVGEEVIRICGTHLVVEFKRRGNSPEMACKKVVNRIVKRYPQKAKTLQVGFLANNKKGFTALMRYRKVLYFQ